MMQPFRPRRDTARAEGNKSIPEPEASGQVAMDKFRSLAQRLLSVSRAEVAEAEAEHIKKASVLTKHP